MPSASTPGSPIFVGGTGRSGTTIAGELVGARADASLIPFELRFHVDKGGLSDLADGLVTVAEFAKKVRKVWFERPPNAQGPRGLGVIATRPEMRQAMGRLRERHPDDPWGATGAFMDEVIRPLCEQSGTTTWVEMTPPNAHKADRLCRMFPEARVVHMVRDGRDVAASVARRRWGPNDIDSALAWWAEHLITIHEAMGRADPSRVTTVRLEALVGPRRKSEYERLVSFLGRPADAGMRVFFDEQLSQEESHPQSWRSGLKKDEQRRVDALYDEQLARLEAHGVTIPLAD